MGHRKGMKQQETRRFKLLDLNFCCQDRFLNLTKFHAWFAALRPFPISKAELSSFCRWCSSLSAVQWVVVGQGANFLNYLSICTARSDDPLRAQRTRVKLRLERNFVHCYLTIKYPNSSTVFQNIGSCFKIQSVRKCF